MNFQDSIRSAFIRFFDFESRSSRSEFWFFFLFLVVVSIAAIILDELMSLGGLLFIIVFVVTLIPSYSVGARRLHDIGRSGWWQLILVPSEIFGFIDYDPVDHGVLIGLYLLISGIAFIVLWATPGHSGRNKYGDNPLEVPHDLKSNTTVGSGATVTRKYSSGDTKTFETTTISSDESSTPTYTTDNEATQFSGVRTKEKTKKSTSSKDLIDKGFKVVRKPKDR